MYVVLVRSLRVPTETPRIYGPYASRDEATAEMDQRISPTTPQGFSLGVYPIHDKPDYMTMDEVRKAITDAGGEIQDLINWSWARFDDDTIGHEVFKRVQSSVHHRGYYEASPHSDNKNLRKGGFRFR